MKIVLCSDNHSNLNAIKKILNDNPDADYYWHLGDSESFDPVKELSPFISVKGNNDMSNDLPVYKVIETGNHRFLLTHGHRYMWGSLEGLYLLAKEQNCDIVLFGHTHMFHNEKFDGVTFINPGSCSHNRNGEAPTYCVIEANENVFKITKKYVDNNSSKILE